ncbi:MAG: UxaA family hydrolase [Roseibium sp.]
MSAFLKLHNDDNVQVALEMCPKGSVFKAGADQITVMDNVAMGHKIADRTIAKGETVLKYGLPIGIATAVIPAGAHVHVHNIASRYTQSHYHDDETGVGQ